MGPTGKSKRFYLTWSGGVYPLLQAALRCYPQAPVQQGVRSSICLRMVQQSWLNYSRDDKSTTLGLPQSNLFTGVVRLSV